MAITGVVRTARKGSPHLRTLTVGTTGVPDERIVSRRQRIAIDGILPLSHGARKTGWSDGIEIKDSLGRFSLLEMRWVTVPH